MYIHCCLLFIVLTISWLALATSYMNSMNNLPLDQRRTKTCPNDGIPACGMRVRDKKLILFPNDCLLNELNKDTLLHSETILKKIPLHYCIGDCRLSCSDINKPVCARNMRNSQKRLFKNQCELTKFVCQKNVDWRIIDRSMCPQDLTKSRRHKLKPTKKHSLTKRSYQNNIYNLYHDQHEYNDHSNEINTRNDFFVYTPQGFHGQYMNNDAASYQHSVPAHETYDEILNKIVTFPPADLHILAEEKKTKIFEPEITEKSPIKPLPFAVNRNNFNYLPDQRLVHSINGQTIPNAMKSLVKEYKNNYYYNFEEDGEYTKIKDITKVPTTITRTTSDSTKIPVNISVTTSRPHVLDKQQPLKGVKENVKCKFGTIEVCGTLVNGTARTFKTVCDMMSANMNLKNKWTKLHDGICEDCKYNCSQDYQPVCVSRNQVNYTMVNDCYYNMVICLDKTSKWKKLGKGECEHQTHVKDKYANTKPGFFYTTSHFVNVTTKAPSTTIVPPANTTKLLEMEVKTSEKSITSKPANTRSRRLSSNLSCCGQLHKTGEKSQDSCECWSDTTEYISTESNIMLLIKPKGKDT